MQIIYDNSNSIYDLIDKINSFTIIKNNNTSEVSKNSNLFKKVKEKIFEISKISRLEPAFGVSLHELTIQEMKHGIWLKINFESEQIKNDLPFTSLLIKLEETGGFNLIREHNGRYDGRCLFLHLEKPTNLLEVLI